MAQLRKGNARAPEAALRHRGMHNLKQTADGKWTWKYDAALRSPDHQLPRPDTAATWALLAKIQCPTLLIRGAESDVLSAEVAARMVDVIPNCTLVTVQESGHSVPLDNPPGFREAVRAFLG
jgi:pimeloyl-ACP methyl ester carboxylesterase